MEQYVELPMGGGTAEPSGSFLMPLLRGGADAPIKQMPRYLTIGAAGEVITGAPQVYDHPAAPRLR
jgi:hypothetical protein